MELMHIWIIVGLVLAIAEMFIPGFAVMCLAIGAFAASGAAYMEQHWQIQAIVFSIVSILATIFVRPIALKMLYQAEDKISTNVSAMVGKKAKVVQEIPTNLEKGKVMFESDEWNAVTKEDLPIPAGKYVIIREVDGNKLIVEAEKE